MFKVLGYFNCTRMYSYLKKGLFYSDQIRTSQLHDQLTITGNHFQLTITGNQSVQSFGRVGQIFFMSWIIFLLKNHQKQNFLSKIDVINYEERQFLCKNGIINVIKMFAWPAKFHATWVNRSPVKSGKVLRIVHFGFKVIIKNCRR